MIGERLYITEATVARHVSNIFGKLGAHTRAEATRIALRRGLLEAGGIATYKGRSRLDQRPEQRCTGPLPRLG